MRPISAHDFVPPRKEKRSLSEGARAGGERSESRPELESARRPWPQGAYGAGRDGAVGGVSPLALSRSSASWSAAREGGTPSRFAAAKTRAIVS